MFNVAVFKMKDMIKYFVGITMTILIVIITTKYFLNHKTESTKKTNIIESQVQKILSKSYVQCMDTQISSIGKINQNLESEAEEETADTSYLKEFMKTEISSIKALENMQDNTDENNKTETQETETQKTGANNETENSKETEKQGEQQAQVELATTGQQTEVITVNPIKETFNTQYRKCKNKKWNQN